MLKVVAFRNLDSQCISDKNKSGKKKGTELLKSLKSSRFVYVMSRGEITLLISLFPSP